MVQINADNYEDLDYTSMTAILDALARARRRSRGARSAGTASCPEGGPTTLKEMVSG